MTKDDPFGLSNDAGRTRIRPTKSQRQPLAPTRGSSGGAAMRQSGAPHGSAPAERVRQARANDNPLIEAFSALLAFAPELERAQAPDNPEVLRARLLENLTYARDAAVGAGVPLSRADQAAWFVAALLDDLAINTPWGGHSEWPGQPLVVSLYGDVDAGERFFDRVEDLLRYPDRDREMLELAYMCLSLGFRGKHRITGPAGEGALTQFRGNIARALRDPDAESGPLSPNWKGVRAADEAPRFIVPLWTIGIAAAALITGIYILLAIRLSDKGEQLYNLAGVLPPAERAVIFRPVRDTEPPPTIEIAPVMIELLPVITAAAPEATRKAISGREDISLAIVVVQATSPEVFRSAKADLNHEYEPLINSIAKTILENRDVIGGITVVGHTDSIPVQRSNPFASNQRLSEARAETIAKLLIGAGVPAEMVKSEGRAASEPIADNGTKAGRARNRRVEIIIEKRL